MIFVTLGSQKFQFNRLLEKLDELIEDEVIVDQVFAQTGYSDYNPKNYMFQKFMGRDEFAVKMSESDIVITHGGTGAIVGALKQGKKVIAVPRMVRYGEHIDDHQLQIIHQFEEMNLIYACQDCNEIAEGIKNINLLEFNRYISNTNAIIKSVTSFIENDIVKNIE